MTTVSHDDSEQCMKYIKDNLYICYERDLIIDPCACAHNEAFINGIDPLAHLTIFYNAQPNALAKIKPLDFLNLDYEKYDKTILAGLWYNDVHIISAPPISEAATLITACCKFAKSISIIVPNDELNHLFSPAYRLSFSAKLADPIISLFQIWIK